MLADMPNWLVMWALSLAIYSGCKLLTWVTTRLPSAPWWKHAGYLFFWPGMDVRRFFDTTQHPPRPTRREWLGATAKLIAGVALLIGIAESHPEWPIVIEGWLAMVGIALTLHFGLFHWLSCLWRSAGVAAEPLMDCPVASENLSEFWGRRWNRAFRDLTHRYLFRPLTPLVGARAALLAGFLLSGAIHDLVITVPAGGGYGQPTLYFLVQGAGLLIERSEFGRRWQLGHGLSGRLFAAVVILGPVGWLFPVVFLSRVLLPFVHVWGVHQ
jgi:hypothetical protein